MIKALMVAATPFFSDRGCHIRIYEEARWLKKLGIQVRLVTYFGGLDLPDLDAVRAGRWARYRKLTAGPSVKKPLVDLSLLFRVREQIKADRPDLLHCHLHEAALIGLLAGSGRPIILDYQGSLAGELMEHQPLFGLPGISKMARMTESFINSRMDRILLNSSSLMIEIDEKARARCRVVGDGVDLDRFCPQPPDLELKAKAGLRDDLPVVVYLGLLNRYQGVDLLLKSAGILARKRVKFQMLIMGYPLTGYPEKARKLGLDEIVKFTGRTDYFQAHRWLSLGDLAVAPKIASSESNGKILNYLAMGLPLVCFDRAVDRELAKDCARYAAYNAQDENRSAASLAAAIDSLLSDQPRRKELAQKGRQRAREHFGWPLVAERILESYRELAG